MLYRDVLRWQSQLYADQQGVVSQKSSVLQSRFTLNQTRNRPAEEVCTLQDLSVEDRRLRLFESGRVRRGWR